MLASRLASPSRAVLSARHSRAQRKICIQCSSSDQKSGFAVSPQVAMLGLVMVGSLLGAGPALAHQLSDSPTHAPAIGDLAAQEEFWSNIARYGRFFVTVMAGTAYIMVKPIAGLFKNPVTAILGIAGLAGTAYFIYFTVNAMLGITDPVNYEPSSIVTPNRF